MKILGGGEYNKPCPKYPAKKGSGKKHSNPGTKALKEIKFYQKQTECFYIPHTIFIRLLKYYAKDYVTDIRLSTESINIFQTFLEDKIIKLFEMAQLCAIHANRMRVESKDIQFPIKYCNDYNIFTA